MAKSKENTQSGALTAAQKMALHTKVEIPINGTKEKIVNYEERDVEIIALDGAKHMKAGEKYTVGSGTAIKLIEKGFAKEA